MSELHFLNSKYISLPEDSLQCIFESITDVAMGSWYNLVPKVFVGSENSNGGSIHKLHQPCRLVTIQSPIASVNGDPSSY